MAKKLKLYVWENVLEDYTSGIMFALATDADHARKVILEAGGEGMHSVEKDLKQEPDCYEDPTGFFLYGGG